jgi:cytochrome b subunit of formate dehydrogenase
MFADPAVARYAGYHFSGTIFWVLPVLAALSCAVHAVRRAFGQPPAAYGDERPDLPAEDESSSADDRAGPFAEKVILRHTLAQRVYHWGNVVAIFVLLVTGLGAILPEGFLGSTPAATRFALHRWFAVVLIVGIPFHVIYDALVRNSFGFMWFGTDAFKTLGHITRNFLGSSSTYPKYYKYHPMQIINHWMMAGNLFALIVTGLILWKPTRAFFPLDLFGLGWGFVFFNRVLHDFFTSSLLALVIGHAYFAVAIKQNWIISKTMLTGRIDYGEYTKHHTIAYEIGVEEGSGARGPG